MIMDNFNETEQSEILELARVALADADVFDQVAAALDLSDEYLMQLCEKIQEHSSGIEIQY